MSELPDDVLSEFHTLCKVPRVPLGETGSEANCALSVFLTNCLRSSFCGSVY